MNRIVPLLLLALGLGALGCNRRPAAPEQPGEPTAGNTPTTEPSKLPVAPMPHRPGEKIVIVPPVTFHPTDGNGATVADDGRYVLPGAPGTAPGKYKITIEPGAVAVAPVPHRPGEKITVPPVKPYPDPEMFPIEIDPGFDPKIDVSPLPELDLRIDGRGAGRLIARAIGVPEPRDVVPGIDPGAIDAPPVVAPPPPGPGLPGGFEGRGGAIKVRAPVALDADSERAVKLGLEWLAKQQKADGNWEFDVAQYKAEKACATAMALLPFLRAGETHKADKNGKKTKHQKTVELAINFLKKACPVGGANSGKISTNMYIQGIVTLALVEAYTTTKDANLRQYAQAAVNFVQKAQAPNGSWGYQPNQDGDTSVTGWQLQALAATRQVKDLVVDDRVVQRAMKYLDSVAKGNQKEMYGYRSPDVAKEGTAVTASALLGRFTLGGWGQQTPGLVTGVEGLAKNPPAPASDRLKDMYYYYYATHVVRYREGEEWATWNEGPKDADGKRKGGMRDWLVKTQVKKDGDKLGSWEPEVGFIGTSCGRLGTTSLALLTLQAQSRPVPGARDPDPKKDNK